MSALHWANNSTSSHPSAPATTPQMVMVMMSSRLCRLPLRPPGILQTAEMFHQAGSLAAAHHHYPSQPEPIPCYLFLASSLDSISTLNLECVCPAVDKFQGQEAPVVIYSMATSAPDEAPHGMEFLYSPNRLNVATSLGALRVYPGGFP